MAGGAKAQDNASPSSPGNDGKTSSVAQFSITVDEVPVTSKPQKGFSRPQSLLDVSRSWRKSHTPLKPSRAQYLCLLCLILLGLGCYFSYRAHAGWSWIGAVEGEPSGISTALRHQCRNDSAWVAMCTQLDPDACRDEDSYRFNDVSGFFRRHEWEQVDWEFNNCGRWGNVLHRGMHEEEICVTSCDSNNKCTTTCTTTDVEDWRKTYENLTTSCGNYKQYLKFSESITFRYCEEQTGATRPPAIGWTTGAVLAMGLGAGVFIVLLCMNF